jgi:hypothetical protein
MWRTAPVQFRTAENARSSERAAARMSFYDEILDASTGAYKVLQNGEWRVSSSGAHTSIANPSKGGVAFRVQGARRQRGRVCVAARGAGCTLRAQALLQRLPQRAVCALAAG